MTFHNNLMRMIMKIKIRIFGCDHPMPHVYLLNGGYCKYCGTRMSIYDY